MCVEQPQSYQLVLDKYFVSCKVNKIDENNKCKSRELKFSELNYCMYLYTICFPAFVEQF